MLDLPQAHRLLKVSFDTPLDDVRRVYRQAARRCHPDSQRAADGAGAEGEAVDFATLSQAFKMIEKDRQSGGAKSSQVRISSGLGEMPVCEQAAVPPPSSGDKKVLSFVAEDGTVVRQEITIRTQKGKNEIMTMDLPPEPSPSSSDHSEAMVDDLLLESVEPMHEFSPPSEAYPSSTDDSSMGGMYLSKDSSRELSFPHPSSTACRIPF